MDFVHIWYDDYRVAMVKEKSLENEKFSMSGKSQGSLVIVREIGKKSEKFRE